jgi:RimJ/RimL family protein N-acetyltransferase
MPALPALAQPLSDGRLRLRDAAERDIPEILIAFEDDPEMHLRLALARPPSGAELGRQAEAEASDRAAGWRAALTIVAPPSDVCLGQVRVESVEWDHSRADISVWVAPQARRRGLATGALDLVAQWLLGACGLARVQGICEPDNQPLLAAADRAGFACEGILHAYLRRRSRRIDVAMLSRLAADPLRR